MAAVKGSHEQKHYNHLGPSLKNVSISCWPWHTPWNFICQIGDLPACSSADSEDLCCLRTWTHGDKSSHLPKLRQVEGKSFKVASSLPSWPREDKMWAGSVRRGQIQLQAAESVLCWVSPGHCHSVFAEGGSVRTFFGRGISQHMTIHTHTHMHSHWNQCSNPANQSCAALVRMEVEAGEGGGWRKADTKSWSILLAFPWLNELVICFSRGMSVMLYCTVRVFTLQKRICHTDYSMTITHSCVIWNKTRCPKQNYSGVLGSCSPVKGKWKMRWTGSLMWYQQ